MTPERRQQLRQLAEAKNVRLRDGSYYAVGQERELAAGVLALLDALDQAEEALRRASERLGELTRPPWNELTPLVADVRDDIRAALAPAGRERGRGVNDGMDRLFQLEDELLRMHRRDDMSDDEKAALLDACNRVMWDDAIHIAAPWEPRSSLCGKWFRNLVALGDERPDGVQGCWTCLMAADWFDAQAKPALSPAAGREQQEDAGA